MSNMETQNNNNNYHFLPELRTEILLRLKMKSLLRFKCVSKSWCRVISSRKFSKAHSDLGAAPTTRLLCVDRLGFKALSIDVDESILRHRTLQLPITRRNLYLALQGSCRGFVLIVHYPNLTVWNPLTDVHKTFSCTLFTSNAIITTNHFYNPIHLWCGLGYHAPTDDYLIFIGWHKKSMSRAEVYSIRNNEWEKIDEVNADFPYKISTDGFKAGKFLNGALHWLATKTRGERVDVILAFDLEGKRFSEIPLPQNLNGYFYSLNLLGGCLGICNGRGEEAMIWVMKEYNVESSWTKIEKIVLPFDSHRSAPLCLTRDERVVASNDMGHLVKFSPRGKYAEHQPNDLNHHELKGMIAYTETLFSLPGDANEVVEENDDILIN